MAGGSFPAWRPISFSGPYGPLSRSTAQPMAVMSELRVAGGTAPSHNRQSRALPRGEGLEPELGREQGRTYHRAMPPGRYSRQPVTERQARSRRPQPFGPSLQSLSIFAGRRHNEPLARDRRDWDPQL